MGRPKRNIMAAAEESTSPPDELTEYQTVARVGRPEGNNLYSCELPNRKTVTAELAQRFRNTIWIKRRGFVVVDLTPDEERSKANSKVQGEIINVIRDEKEWRKMPYWCVEAQGLRRLRRSPGDFVGLDGHWLIYQLAGPRSFPRMLTMMMTKTIIREISHRPTPKTRHDDRSLTARA